MPPPADPKPDDLFEDPYYREQFARADPGPRPAPEPVPPPDAVPAPVGPAPAAPSTAGWGVLGSIGTIALLVIGSMVVKGIKQAAVKVAQGDGPQAQQSGPNPVPLDRATQEHVNRLFDPKRVPDPPAPPPWEPTPAGQSPFDRFRAADLPAQVRAANRPNGLVAVIDPDPKRDWATDLGLHAVTGRGDLLDARRLPNAPAATRFLVREDEAVGCYDRADGRVTPVAALDADEELARLTLAGDHALLCDGTDVRRVGLAGGGDGDLLELDDPPSPYVQMELFDRDRVLVLRRADGRVRKVRLSGYRAAGVTDLGGAETADHIAASPDRRMLVAVSTDRRAVTFTEADGGTARGWTITLPVRPVRAAIHPGRAFVAVTDSTHTTRVFGVDGGTSFGTVQSRTPPRHVEFAADGRHLLLHDASGKIYVFRHDQMARPRSGPPAK